MDRRETPLAVQHNHVAGENVSVNYLHYGADVTIDPGMLGSFYLLQIPLSGKALIHHRGDVVAAGSDKATLLNPDRETRMHWRGDCQKLLLQVSREHLNAVATGLIGAPLPGPIRFDTEVDLTTPNGSELKRMVVSCARAIDAGDLFQGLSAASDMRVETDLALALLTLQANNVSHIIDRSDGGATPRGLRLAVEYIHGNLTEPLSLQQIATHAQMNVRTLQKGFRRRFGVTPMQFVRNARLDAAHYQLTSRRDPPTVTTVAFGNGFSHLGRFSRDYKARFGRLPSKMH
ncbi:AraC family transcriptional regulator [Roseobacter sp. YSTF-M11]|uniref:AraC family transcriptional regulator n=2 Tax=Roseobacter insulae TaxID=2859783 RepID=A0A9X1FXX6_9RHOB|nr:AraC family transcriptional regulator [Roseobacter insulae]